MTAERGSISECAVPSEKLAAGRVAVFDGPGPGQMRRLSTSDCSFLILRLRRVLLTRIFIPSIIPMTLVKRRHQKGPQDTMKMASARCGTTHASAGSLVLV